MPLRQSGDKSAYFEWRIYDAILMELTATHPTRTIFEEADLKWRLLQTIGTHIDQHDPGQLMRLFREATDGLSPEHELIV